MLGARAEEIEAGADLSDALVVRCEDWEEGQGASLRAGIRACAERSAAVMVTLADEPFLPPGAAGRLIAARASDVTALRATYEGRPGHPVLIEHSLFPALTAPGPPPEPRTILRDAGIRGIECGDLGIPRDVDTPAQLEALSRELRPPPNPG